MTEYRKISKWVDKMERTLKGLHRERAAIESRIASKIDRMVTGTLSDEFAVPQDRQRILARLSRMARLLEAENTMSTLEQVENEVDAIYGDTSNNGSYYFGRKSAGGGELQEMKDLTTWDQDEPRKREVLPEEDFESVQDLLKKSSWSDFAPEPRYGFEDDGEYIDSEDMLDIDIPSPYQFEQEDPLDDF